MKLRKILVFLTLALLLVACGKQDISNDTDKLQIVTSFFPNYDLVSKIGGDKVDIVNLTSTGDAHSFEPNIRDMENISKADLLVINGAGFEGWVDKVVSSQGDLKILDLSKNLNLIEVDTDQGKVIDPHTWLSVKNPQIMMNDIKNKLIELDPDNKTYYENNYDTYLAEFNVVKDKYDKELAAFAGRAFIAPHAAFNYLVEDYNLEQVGIEGINSISEPNAARMKEIIDIMNEKNIKVVFYEYGQSDKIATTIAKEVQGEALPISTLEVITQEDIDNGQDYITLLEMNLTNLLVSFNQ